MLSTSQPILHITYICNLPNNTNELDKAGFLSPPPSYESVRASDNVRAYSLKEAVEVPSATSVVCAAENVDSNSKIYNKVVWLPSQVVMVIEKTIIGVMKAIYCTLVILISASLGLAVLHLEMMFNRSNIMPSLMPIVGASCKKLLGYAISTEFLDPYIA